MKVSGFKIEQSQRGGSAIINEQEIHIRANRRSGVVFVSYRPRDSHPLSATSSLPKKEKVWSLNSKPIGELSSISNCEGQDRACAVFEDAERLCMNCKKDVDVEYVMRGALGDEAWTCKGRHG